MAANRGKYYNVTVDGISLKIKKDVLDDVEMVELLGAVQDGDIFAFPKLARLMFGEEGFSTVKKGLAKEDGRTRMTDVVDFFTRTLDACNATAAKN